MLKTGANLKPTKEVRKFEFPARKFEENFIINNFDCSSFIPFTQKIIFIHISPKNFRHYSENLMKY